nr:PAS domain S-box protein [uncultured Desulfobacter sp.]
MKDEDKTKSQLIAELQEMRKRVAALTQSLEDMEGIASEEMSSLSEPAYQNSQQARSILESRRISESLKLTQFCFDNADIGIFQITTNGRIFNANAYAARMLGYTTEELTKLSLPDINPFVSVDTLNEDIDRIIAPGRINFETVHIKKDGSRIPVGITSNRFEYNDQEYSVAFVQDITERKQTETSLRLAKAIFDKAPIGIWRMGPNGEILDVNDKGCESLGYSRKKLLRMKVFDVAPGFTTEHWAENIRILNEAGFKTTEAFHQNKNGKIIPVQVIENLMKFENQEFLVAFIQDITERKQNEEALREKDRLLYDIGKMVKIGGWKYDIETGKVTWTDEVSLIHDLESNQELSVEKGFVFFHGEHRKKIECAFNELHKNGRPYDLVLEFISAKGIQKWVRTTGFPIIKDGIVVQLQGALQDITERKRMEEMMIQNEKMLSVGGLAAGMAHEVNNPLAGMMQTAQVMAQRLRAGSTISANQKAAEAAGTTMEAIEQFMKARGIQNMIEAIMISGQRASEIVNGMLNFVRKDSSCVTSHDLGQILDKTIELASTDYDLKKAYDFKRIKIIREYDNDLPAVPCQVGKIQQVVFNILTNGAQAMKEAETPEPRFILRTYSDPDHDMACMEIEDCGPGMNEKVRKHIFDPFFTTKPVGMGTGLGLSVSYFIITENHNGEMTVDSSPGTGAKFIIHLPMSISRHQHET